MSKFEARVVQASGSHEVIKGAIKLRGIIVPIVDMCSKFHLRKVEYDQFTVVIILNIANRVVGIVVDNVSDVIALMPDQIKPSPEFSTTPDTQYIADLGTVGERTIIEADIENLLSIRDVGLFGTATA